MFLNKLISVLLTALTTIGVIFPSFATDYQVVQRGELAVDHPAFISFAPQTPGSTAPELLISTFRLFGADPILRISQVEKAFRDSVPTISLVTDKIVWPNEINYLDADVFGHPGYLVASGFILPNKRTGSISFVDEGTGFVSQLTTDKADFFYHRAVFTDMDGRGKNSDIITARAKIPFLFGAPEGELLWLHRPAAPLAQRWQETILAKGPDIHFRVFADALTGETMIVAAEFSNKQLSLFWIEKDGQVGHRIIDDGLGAPFDLDFYDLNNDSKLDLLVTNHQSDKTAAVFAYEVPADLKNGIWIRHTLLAGIETRQAGHNQASPGVAKAFFPSVNNPSKEKPWILVSGDGSQRLHMLVPLSQATADWSYSESVILDTKSTVGEPMIYDFDHDGFADFVVPAYDTGKLYFLSILPK